MKNLITNLKMNCTKLAPIASAALLIGDSVAAHASFMAKGAGLMIGVVAAIFAFLGIYMILHGAASFISGTSSQNAAEKQQGMMQGLAGAAMITVIAIVMTVMLNSISSDAATEASGQLANFGVTIP